MTSSSIYCPPNGLCDIICFHQRACDDSTLIAGASGTLLTVNASSNSAFYDGKILCGNEGTCNLNCDGQDSCRNVLLDAKNAFSTDIQLETIGTNSFYNGSVYGSENGQMNIRCEETSSCRNTLIKAHIGSTFLNINVNADWNVLQEATIYCPDNGNAIAITCDITCVSAGCLKQVTVYAVESFHDVNIHCSASSNRHRLEAICINA
eukprot:372786_1